MYGLFFFRYRINYFGCASIRRAVTRREVGVFIVLGSSGDNFVFFIRFKFVYLYF